MLKFLIYLFILYVIMRLLFGKISGNTIKVKTMNYTTHKHYAKEEDKPEGTVIIEAKENKKGTNKDNQLGEYVDYEEVK